MTYIEAVEKIEEIMSKIENEELDIDELAGNVKQASELLKFCKSKLRDTKIEIEKILDDINGEEE